MQKERLSVIIKNYRKKYGLTQEQFGRRCGGLSKAYISVLEREEDPKTHEITKPTLETYEMLAKGMGMTRDELISRVEGRPMFERIIFQTATAYNVPVVKKFTDILSINEEGSNELEIVKIPEDIYKKNNTVALKIDDDDLFPEIRKNDIVIIWLEEQYSDGDYVLASWSVDNSLRCYRVQAGEGTTILYGNLYVNPIRLEDSSKITILGKVVFVQKKMLKV